MPISDGRYVAPTWEDNTYPYINASELNAMSTTLEKVPVENGGTGATTAAAARTALGITPQNIGAIPTTGGTINGNLAVTGMLDANAKNVTGVVAVEHGGTGATTVAGIRNVLGLGNTSGALPIASGGTGATTAAAARNALGLGNTTGALPVANGGTGATTVAGARNALGLGNTAGAVPMANGGTGATNGSTGLGNLLSVGPMILSSHQYGTTLPEPGLIGRVFFKKV